MEQLCKNLDLSEFVVPLSFVGKEGYSNIDILNNPIFIDDALEFPFNIEKINSKCITVDNSWYLVGQLNSGNYFFYRAWCVDGGFEELGTMILSIYREDQINQVKTEEPEDTMELVEPSKRYCIIC